MQTGKKCKLERKQSQTNSTLCSVLAFGESLWNFPNEISFNGAGDFGWFSLCALVFEYIFTNSSFNGIRYLKDWKQPKWKLNAICMWQANVWKEREEEKKAATKNEHILKGSFDSKKNPHNHFSVCRFSLELFFPIFFSSVPHAIFQSLVAMNNLNLLTDKTIQSKLVKWFSNDFSVDFRLIYFVLSWKLK